MPHGKSAHNGMQPSIQGISERPTCLFEDIKASLMIARSLWEGNFKGESCFCRFLVSAEAAELPVAVILNKADLVPQQQCDEAVREVWSPPEPCRHGATPVSSSSHVE